MSSHPLVSIIIPSFNHAGYIREALDSVFHQRYPRLELMLWDDCSSDHTFDLAVEHIKRAGAAKFERVELKQGRYNRGAHETINDAIKSSNGQYISILNSDDAYCPGRISKLVAAMEGADSGLAFSGVSCIDEAGKDVSVDFDCHLPLTAAARVEVNCPTMSFGFLGQQIAISTGNLVFRRSLYDSIGGFIPLRYCHDWDFILQSILFTEPVFVNESLYRYRVHSTNSFKSLGSVGGIETDVALSRYFKKSLHRRSANKLAPTPYNWPGIFEQYLRLAGVYHIWERNNLGFRPDSRTISAADIT